MKRPSGFDRAPERREPPVRADAPARRRTVSGFFGGHRAERGAPAASEPSTHADAFDAADAPGAAVSPEHPETPETPERERAAEGGASSGAERAPSAPDSDGEGAGEQLAATVDLSEVRSGGGALVRANRSADPVREAEQRMRTAQRQLKRRERRERRRFSFASRRRRRWWLVAGGAVLALAIFVLAGVFTPVMSVRNIEISGASAVNPADLQQALDRFSGTPLALVDDGEVRGALEPFALVERYAVERIPPDTLLVRIEERVPVISIGDDGAYQLYDAAGVLVGSAEAPPAGVPVADGRAKDLGSEAFASAARVLRDMPAELRTQVTAVSASSGQDVLLALTNGAEVMWGGPEETARKAIVLTTMFSSLADRPVSYLDVSSSEAPVFR
ncbi:FtsQ-type POTRA domain-containing protein [Leucobacter sp. GX0328]